MSKRARSARRLASRLTSKSGTFVRVYYDRQIRRYRVVWTNGPDAAQMFTFAIQSRDEVPELDVATLLWDRGTSNNGYEIE
ncbi:MAG: hypothetical protein ABW215_16100 [Kibdelosporangium sp.]